MSNEIKQYGYSDDLTEVFVGKRIVAAEMGVRPPVAPAYPGSDWQRPIVDGTDPTGLLTLDDGTQVYVAGNDGGCACSAGCYDLTKLATTDNIITSVKVIDQSSGDYSEGEGRYSIFVITAAEELNVAEFEGDDGNGYYGTGFHLAVVPA